MRDAVIVSTARTPIGKAFRGAFNQTHGAVLAGHAIAHAVERATVEPGEVEDVVIGCGLPEGATGHNVARLAALKAGLPVTTAGTTINRFNFLNKVIQPVGPAGADSHPSPRHGQRQRKLASQTTGGTCYQRGLTIEGKQIVH